MNEKIFRFRSTDKWVGGISYHRNTVNESFLLHTHDYYEFEIAVSGCGVNYINDKGYEVERGSIWALGPEDLHKLDCKGLTVCNISLYLPSIGDDLSRYIRELNFPMSGKVAEDVVRVIENAHSLLVGLKKSDELYSAKLSAITKFIMLEFVSHLKHAEGNISKTADYVRRAVRYLHDFSEEDIGLDSVADKLHIAPAYLSGIFPQYAGCGFNEYLTRTRLGRAKDLLRHTDKTVTEIAGLCGFGCVSAMNRAFKKYFNTSPSIYRKTH